MMPPNNAPMKKIIPIGFIIVLTGLVGFFSWQHLKHAKDARIFKNLPGTWKMSIGSVTVQPGGSYVLQYTESPTSVVTNEGNLQVRDGFLIDTVTRSSRTNARVPYVKRSRIIQADDRELTIDNGGKSGLVLRKEAI
jgi:hypothetical protein